LPGGNELLYGLPLRRQAGSAGRPRGRSARTALRSRPGRSAVRV
jgi:hypothetical protein